MTTAISTQAIERAALVTEEAMTRLDVLIAGAETVFVAETPTGLSFDADTPLEVWARLTVRLIVAHKRIEFCLADAITFGEQAYGDLYAQWVTETGLNKRTLQNYARIGKAIEPARRRAGLSFAHHAEVVTLPVSEQDIALDHAQSAGMTRYELRDAVRERKRKLEDQAVAEEQHVWVPTRSDLTTEARDALDQRLAGMGKAYRIGGERLWIDALVWAEVRDAFLPGRWGGPE